MSQTPVVDPIVLTIDGRETSVAVGTTIWQAAAQMGIEIPALCHTNRLRPVGVCRLCVVDVGERVLSASCVRSCQPGMVVQTRTASVESHRRILTELLLSEHPVPCARERSSGDCELEELGQSYGLISGVGMTTRADSSSGSATAEPPNGIRLRSSTALLADPQLRAGWRALDNSSKVISVDHQACILCDRCIRACDELQSNDIIGRTGKGFATRIGFDLNQSMGDSHCVSCGECASVCPTGALTHKPVMTALPVVPGVTTARAADSVCPYCGVGCAITFHVSGDRIVAAEGRESPVNHERLCVKGRYGWDYTHHPHRLTSPLIRRTEAYPKTPLSSAVRSSLNERASPVVDYAEVLPAFREASWQEALDLVGDRLKGIQSSYGSNALAAFGSAKCSNEEAYLLQKLVRAGFGTNNIDHCTRLCHASSVAALMETIGSGAVTNVFGDVCRSTVALVTGSHTASNHPVAATFIKDAAKHGTRLIVVDVRRHELADYATHFAQIRPGTDVAFYNGLMHVLLSEGWLDQEFIERRTEGFEQLKAAILGTYSPEYASSICGVSAGEIRQIAKTIGLATPPGGGGSMLIFWGMGISQHTTGTDNARCLISLALMTGNVGKPGAGLHPLRGQNNVQGASDAGLIPMVYPDYQPVGRDANRTKFEAAWGRPLSPKPGLTVVEIMKGALAGEIRGMYIMGENPFLSDPNSNKVRRALASLQFLVVQDIFLTETAEFADVILPASSYFEKTGTFTNTDRRVQLGHAILSPPGDARQDWRIICDISERMGLPMSYQSPADVFAEFASLTTSYQGLSHDNLGATGKLWPCANPTESDGTQILFSDRFPTPSGRGRFVPCRYQPANELPDEEYPLVLNTGRVLEHWHTGSMTRRSAALQAISPIAFVAVHPQDLARLELTAGELVQVQSRRGSIRLEARADDTLQPGSIFIPFHFREAAANILTTDVLDPFGKIPEFKFCAVRLIGESRSNDNLSQCDAPATIS